MFHSRRLVLIIVGLVLLSLACSGGGIISPTPRVPTSEPTQPPTQSSGGFKITVDNQSKRDICEVYISPTGQESWGANWLDGTIKSGKSRSFEVSPGQYDVIVYDCEDAALASAWEVGSTYTLTVGGRGLVELVLKNVSSGKVCYVYISPATNDSWGEDWLGMQESLETGETRVFFVEKGTYDLMAQDCDENTLAEEYNVDIKNDITWTLKD